MAGPSDAVKIAVANGLVSLAGTAISAVVVFLLAKLNVRAKDAADAVSSVKIDLMREGNRTTSQLENAARQVAKVRETLSESDDQLHSRLDEMAAVGQATHVLVNSNMGDQLKLNALLSRRVAEITKLPEDLEAAVLSESKLRDHESKQAVVDKTKEKMEGRDR
jgi:hypothetical protein